MGTDHYISDLRTGEGRKLHGTIVTQSHSHVMLTATVRIENTVVIVSSVKHVRNVKFM